MPNIVYTIAKHVKYIHMHAAHSLVSAEYHLQAARKCSAQLVLAWSNSQKNDIGSWWGRKDIYNLRYLPVNVN